MAVFIEIRSDDTAVIERVRPRDLHPLLPVPFAVAQKNRGESVDRASGYFTTRADTDPNADARTAGIYWRASADDTSVLDGRDDQKRVALIAEQLMRWKSSRNA